MRKAILVLFAFAVVLLSASVALAADAPASQPAVETTEPQMAEEAPASPAVARPLAPRPCALQSLWILQSRSLQAQIERMQLGDNQKTKVAEVMAKAEGALKPLIEAQRKAALDYVVLLINADAKEADVKAAGDAAMKAEAPILAENIKALFAVRALLTPTQLSQFNAALEIKTRMWRNESAPVSATATTPSSVREKPKPFTKSWVTAPSGLQYGDSRPGSGPAAKVGDVVSVHYKGWLDNGTVFDTSRKPGRQAFMFKLGASQVIKGWDEGVVGMQVGGVRELKVPAALGYGDQGMGDIPANSTLHFEVELLKIGG